MNSAPVFNHAEKTTDAIVCQRDVGHYVAAVMHTYAAIDQMSWLSIPGDMSSGKAFKAWVKKYMLANGNLVCSKDDLWAARNGLRHMGIAKSRDDITGVSKHKIYYTVGNATCTGNSSQDVVFLNVEKLIMACIAGVLWFMRTLRVTKTNYQSHLLR